MKKIIISLICMTLLLLPIAYAQLNNAPYIFIYSPENTTYYNPYITANITSYDDNSTIFHLKINISGYLTAYNYSFEENVEDNETFVNNSFIYEENIFWNAGIYNLSVWANDTDGNENTSSVIFSVIDNTTPTYTNFTGDALCYNQTASFWSYWSDDFGLDGYIFSHDDCFPSGYVNDSFVQNEYPNWNYTEQNGLALVTKFINSTIGCTYKFEFYANDTSNNWKKTTDLGFNVQSCISITPPIINSCVIIPNTVYGNQSVNFAAYLQQTTYPLDCWSIYPEEYGISECNDASMLNGTFLNVSFYTDDTPVGNYTLHCFVNDTMENQFNYTFDTLHVLPAIPSIIIPCCQNISTKLDNISEILSASYLTLDDIIGVLLATHSTPVSRAYCSGNFLIEEKNATWTVKNKVYPITKNETTLCAFGCDAVSNSCRPDTFWTIIGTIIALVAFVGLLYWLYRKV
jgi:hypothetical protein